MSYAAKSFARASAPLPASLDAVFAEAVFEHLARQVALVAVVIDDEKLQAHKRHPPHRLTETLGLWRSCEIQFNTARAKPKKRTSPAI